MSITNEQLMEHIEKMSVLEMSELVKAMEERFGVSAAPVAQTSAAGPTAGETAQEQTEFSVVLKEVGIKKINVIKEVRGRDRDSVSKRRKNLVESAPKTC